MVTGSDSNAMAISKNVSETMQRINVCVQEAKWIDGVE